MAFFIRVFCTALLFYISVSAVGATGSPAITPAKGRTDRLTDGGGKTLADVLGAIEAAHGIRFNLASDLGKDPLQGDASASYSPKDIPRLLKGYNWLGTQDIQGRLVSVSVTGRNGNGEDPAINKPGLQPLLTYRKAPARVQNRYGHYPPGSVFPVDIPVKLLRGMALGEHLSLNLPDGQYDLRHDHAWDHPGGDKTWVARAEGDPHSLYRALITVGEGDVIDGQIRTPHGLYQLESDTEGQWLIDINAAGLQRGMFEENGQLPSITALPPAFLAASAGQAHGGGEHQTSSTGFDAETSKSDGQARIDVLLLYTDGLDNKGVKTRLNSLMALANQALTDSRANVVLNLAATRRVNYPDAVSNHQALEKLTQQKDEFRDVAKQREDAGADLVLLVRAFQPKSQGLSCGEAWVNGSGGLLLSPGLAYGVVNDGRADGYYCSNYTLAHEIGHLMGAAHDRKHAGAPGRFTFSHGYGAPGRFGDIMSYYHPEVGVYANPELHECTGQPCGIPIGQPQPADVVATFKRTAKEVAAFVKARSE